MSKDSIGSTHSAVRLYISHAQDDDPEDRELLGDLISLLRRKDEGVRFKVDAFSELLPGDVLDERRVDWLNVAEIIVLFVTSAYINSEQASKDVDESLRQRASRRAIVVPVILTSKEWSQARFGNIVPIRPQNIAYKLLFRSEIVREIRSSLINLAKSRLILSRVRREFLDGKHPYRPFSFRSAWANAAGILVLASIGALVIFSKNPAAFHIASTPVPSPSKFLVNSFVIGTAAMSMLQVFRRMIRMRGAFHRELVLEWLGEPAASQLYMEVGRGRIADMFDLPSELLTGQLSAIAEQVLEKESKSERESPLVSRMSASNDFTNNSEANDGDDGRVNIAMKIQRNLDQFQISAAAEWKRYLLITSVLLSMALFVIGLPLLNFGDFIPLLKSPAEETCTKLRNFMLLLAGTSLSALFAGFIGSISRDVVAIIEKIRR